MHALRSNGRGTVWMLASAVSFTAETVLIKHLGRTLPAGEQLLFRNGFAFILLLPLIARDSRAAFATTRPGLILFRSATGVAGLLLAFIAYRELPLADANALSFTRVLWLVLLARYALGERVALGRMLAVAVGFGGVLVMLRPGAIQGSVLGQVAAVSAALVFALSIASLKSMTRDHTPFTLMVYAATLGVVLVAPVAAWNWRAPTSREVALLAVLGAAGLTTQGCYIKGMQAGDASAMAPVDYSRLIFAALAGYVFFHDTPTAATAIGAVLIAASTLYIGSADRIGVRAEPPRVGAE